MTTLQQIKEELKIINDARDKATPGEWVVQQKSLSNFDHPYVFDRTYGGIFDPIASSTKMINRPNCDFICLAANRIAQLTKSIEVMAEALEFYSNRKNWEYWHNHDVGAHQEWNTFRPEIYNGGERANNSLKQVSEILKG